jgi:hypothetical protein
MSAPTSRNPQRPDRRESGPGRPDRPADEIAGRVLSGSQTTAVWVGRSFLVLALVLSGWIVVLGVTLPHRGVLEHQEVVWVGFDVGLLVGMVATAWAALRRNRFLPVASAATASLLLRDAWFDVVGSSTRMQAMEALTMALLVELPLSGLCWWIALHSQTVAERRIASLVVWRRSASDEAAPEDLTKTSDTTGDCIP